MKSVFVFDLDFTLWDAGGTWCDCTMPPYKNVNNHIEDFNGSKIQLYADVIKILESLKQQGKTIAVASRTNAPNIAREFLERFNIRQYIDIEEIYPRGKTAHLSKIMEQTNASEEDIVFFDDEMRNISDVSRMGIESVYINSGLTFKVLKQYL